MTLASWLGVEGVPRGVLLCAVALTLVACGEPAPKGLREWQPSDHQPPPVVTPDGQGAGDDGVAPERRAALALWGMRCASCHGAEGRGDGAGRPPGAALPDLTAEAFHTARSDEQLATVIAEGKGLMPAFKAELTNQGIVALVVYVRSLRAAPAAQNAQPQ